MLNTVSGLTKHAVSVIRECMIEKKEEKDL